jgi:hypothetical protein
MCKYVCEDYKEMDNKLLLLLWKTFLILIYMQSFRCTSSALFLLLLMQIDISECWLYCMIAHIFYYALNYLTGTTTSPKFSHLSTQTKWPVSWRPFFFFSLAPIGSLWASSLAYVSKTFFSTLRNMLAI